MRSNGSNPAQPEAATPGVDGLSSPVLGGVASADGASHAGGDEAFQRRAFAREICERHRLRREAVPHPEAVETWVGAVTRALFPEHAGTPEATEDCVARALERQESLLSALLERVLPGQGHELTEAMRRELPRIFADLLLDAEATMSGDPAARTLGEVVAVYPGFRATISHRMAHALLTLGVPVVPRMISEHAHARTGIDIHPGASIGPGLCIDHGTGVVIGETATLGRGVKIYQGVTLGAISVRRELANTKRHPTIEDRVTLYAGATVLGGDTVVGAESIIGANVCITASVPPRSIVSQRPEELRLRRTQP
ncbi:MAG: serine O-acetyltransferase EpsC [Planctomycetota bacterium]|nr:serine O-acetyltransferase EpsC [Planctomycetota bacterium]